MGLSRVAALHVGRRIPRGPREGDTVRGKANGEREGRALRRKKTKEGGNGFAKVRLEGPRKRKKSGWLPTVEKRMAGNLGGPENSIHFMRKGEKRNA